jgi:hypothetical protein
MRFILSPALFFFVASQASAAIGCSVFLDVPVSAKVGQPARIGISTQPEGIPTKVKVKAYRLTRDGEWKKVSRRKAGIGWNPSSMTFSRADTMAKVKVVARDGGATCKAKRLVNAHTVFLSADLSADRQTVRISRDGTERWKNRGGVAGVCFSETYCGNSDSDGSWTILTPMGAVSGKIRVLLGDGSQEIVHTDWVALTGVAHEVAPDGTIAYDSLGPRQTEPPAGGSQEPGPSDPASSSGRSHATFQDEILTLRLATDGNGNVKGVVGPVRLSEVTSIGFNDWGSETNPEGKEHNVSCAGNGCRDISLREIPAGLKLDGWIKTADGTFWMDDTGDGWAFNNISQAGPFWQLGSK